MKKSIILNDKEVGRLLNLPAVTIQRWQHQGKIPSKRIHHKNMFDKKEIIEWARTHDLSVRDPEVSSLQNKDDNIFFANAIQRGGIFRNIPGNDVYTVFEQSLNKLPFIPEDQRKSILEELLYREELASTGIGNGIAIPHPRNQLKLNLKDSRVAVFFLENMIDFNAVDNLPVKTMFMIFSSSVKEHLKILSRLSFCVQKQEVGEIIKAEDDNGSLLSTIQKIEETAV